MAQVVSFPLALSRTDQSLYCSLHKCSNPYALSKRFQTGRGDATTSSTTATGVNSNDGSSKDGADGTLSKDDSSTATPTLALLNARRIVGISQLCCAANLACQRPTSPTWDTVFLVAASTHLGHVLRDYAFVRNDDNDDDAAMVINDSNANDEEEYIVIVFTISNCGLEYYQSLLEQHGLSDTMMDLEELLQKQRETLAHEFQSWYKLTTQELASSTLEACVLTKIATKMAA
ncbi:hypothetical protein MHU86_24082 [Fragilaria crotonensis]|nr:hypothetical protein MHU86_24082 [Fragilaria crotonensis]